MRRIVSNVGLRVLQAMRDRPDEPLPVAREVALELLDLRLATAEPARDGDRLVGDGLASLVDDATDDEAIELRYRRNPLEHLDRLVLEYTTLCQLDCAHCRNGQVAPATERRPEALARAVDVAASLGLRRVDFVGGEVLLYGAGWLDVVRHARRHAGVRTAVVTSGWFLGERDFKAAGERYADDRALLDALAAAGLTHVIFSLDGPAAAHDRSRGVAGLHDRILAGLGRVREAGLTPQVSLVLGPAAGPDEASRLGWVASVARSLYGERAYDTDAARRLLGDEMNYVSRLVDAGNAVRLRRSRDDGGFEDTPARCKNFFRPRPSLRIQATGEVSLCPLVDAGEGYGNIHDRPLLDILNTMQDAFIYRLHAEARIDDYRRFLDPSVFGRFEHLCGLRTALGMVARRMHERGVDPGDRESIAAINREVARRTGHLPAVGRRANGTRLPY